MNVETVDSTPDTEQPRENLEEQEGTTWSNPGIFPDFNSGGAPLASEEDTGEGSEGEQLLARISRLRSKEVPEGKFKLPSACYDEVIESMPRTGGIAYAFLSILGP